MTMVIKIVLGLGYGDEGKGKTVDWLCNGFEPSKTVVVRFSAGQQCGHTVMNNRGKHIHSSFPSGTLRGCEGYISSDCTVSPIHMFNEWQVLSRLQPDIRLTVHPLAHLTTPFEIQWNRVAETVNNHGSCGMGVGATMHRNLQTPYKLYVQDLTDDWVLNQKLHLLEQYYKQRVADWENGEFYHTFMRGATNRLREFKDAVQWFRRAIFIDHRLPYAHQIIFEGSQGILLDMDHGFFPHVTYANTTSKNAWKLIDKHCVSDDINDIRTYYVARTYLTRHGNGPMPNEDLNFKLKNIEEEINTENFYQGKFRLAPYNKPLMKYAFDIDRLYNQSRSVFCLNCVDQIESYNAANFIFWDVWDQSYSRVIRQMVDSGTPRSVFQKVF